MSPLPNPGMDFTPFDILPAASLDDMVENIESLADGSAFDSESSIPSYALYNPYKFRAFRTATHVTANNADAIIVMDTETFDTNNNFSTSTGRYTAPISGFYYFSAGVYFESGGSLAGNIKFYKNGTLYVNGVLNTPQTANAFICTVSDLISLQAGDYIEPWTFTSAATGVLEGSPNCFFSGFLLSRT